MDSDTIAALAVIAFAAGFAIFFFFVIFKIVRAMQRKIPANVSIKPLTKEQLNTVVTLTPAEQKKMRGNLTIGFGIASVIFLTAIVGTAWNYKRFVLDGISVQATVLNLTSHHSSGRNGSTSYRYTLRANVNGIVVTDYYGSGSSHPYQIGEVIRAYATTDASPDLALASLEERDPFIMLGAALIYCVILFIIMHQHRRIVAGKMMIRNLPKDIRRARLVALRAAQGVDAPESIVSQTPRSADGKPMYTIGGDDGKNYRP